MTTSKLIGDFYLLRDHCIDLMHSYYTYTYIFCEENRNILNRVAPVFFTDIAKIMQRDWILQACKLMDPARTTIKRAYFENISIKLINEQLEACGSLSSEIKDISHEILQYGEKIKPARHKRLAHYDREHQVSNLTLGETTENELSEFLRNVQTYCDKVGIAIGVGPLDFGGGGCKGDVLDFLKFLRSSADAKQLQGKRLSNTARLPPPGVG